MANAFLKAQTIVDTALGLLSHDIVVPSFFWRDGELSSGRTGIGDAVTLRLPAYTTARTRVLRSAGPLVMDELHERAITLALTTDVYKGVKVTDEELTMDITDFGRQILAPSAAAVAREVEELAVATMTGATYANNVTMTPGNARAAILTARNRLNQANVPMENRVFAMGSDIEQELLGDTLLTQVDTSGSSTVLRDAVIGRLYGFTLVTVPALPVNVGIAFHNTAFAMAQRAPVVPDGAAFGKSATFEGMAMRWIRDYDALNITDRSILSTYVGFGVVTDQGSYIDGRFEPSVVPDAEGDDEMFIRAVKVTLAEDSP